MIKAEYITHMGDDLMVANVARVSFAKTATVLGPREHRLIQYLASNGHWTPFGHPHITIRCSAPISIRTQAYKHKVGFIENEESRRYISDEPEVYAIESFRSRPDGSIKQGSGEEHYNSATWLQQYDSVTQRCIFVYEQMIADGVAPEQARFVLPQGTITNWIWTGSLAAYARFYKLRSDPHAQKEIQLLAEQIQSIIEPLFPLSWAALVRTD